MMKKIAAIMLAAVIMVSLLCGCSDISSIGKELLSGSDVSDDATEGDIARWEQAADDEAYLTMMNEKMQEYITRMTQISAMRERLSTLGGAREIKKDGEFAAAAQSMTVWCQSAVSYPKSTLTDEKAQEICGLCSELGSATSVYVENLPDILSGSYSGEIGEEQYLNSIIESAVEIYTMLNTPAADAEQE